MKLVSLYIENFGALNQFELNFEDGLTTVNQSNGFGKSTLAEFIRAMFYGFPRKVKTLEKSKRQKYAPWNGGLFGGSLVFQYEKQRYRIERTFGVAPKWDTFTLIDLSTNRRSDRFSEEIGVELFGLDSDSFERSIYVPQNSDTGPLATAVIQAKLTNLMEDSSDVNNYDKAMAQLRSKRSALIPYRGSGGAVAEANGKITQLQLQLDELLPCREQLCRAENTVCELQAQLEKNRAELADVTEQLGTASEMTALSAQQHQYEQLQQRCQQAEQQAKSYEKKFPNGQPDLRRCREMCAVYDQLQKKIRELEQYAAQLLQEDRKSDAAGSVKTYAGMLLIGILCSIFGATGLAGGIACLYFGKMPMAVAALCGGVGFLAAGIALLIARTKKRRAQATIHQLRRKSVDNRIAAVEQELKILCAKVSASANEISAFFDRYGIDVPPQHFLAGLMQLEHDLRSWAQVRHAVRELTEQLTAMEQEWGEVLYAQNASFGDAHLLRERERNLREEAAQQELQLQQELRQIRRLREQVAQIPHIREELTICQKNIAKMREEVRILDDTMDFLQQARERLSGSYRHTIESRFGYYLARLQGSTGEKYLIDSDLQVQLERMGKSRELAYFSAGQADLVMLCMRLALVDALFKGDRKSVV